MLGGRFQSVCLRVTFECDVKQKKIEGHQCQFTPKV